LWNRLGTVVIETDKRDGSSRGGAGVVSLKGIASKHTEPFRISMELFNGTVGESAGALSEICG